MSTTLRIGTRGSRLALIQTEMVRAKIAVDTEVVVFETKGDLNRAVSIEEVGGRGVFTDELDQALLDGAIDLAVHSVKDLPVPLDRRLILAATLEREDPREALVSPRFATLDQVPQNAVFGSASRRRELLVKALRPDVRFDLLRGNVEQRVAALEARPFDGTILAVAGLKRLGLESHIKQIFPADVMMPDPGQGAIGIVCRAGDARARFVLAGLNHAPTLSAITAERAFLAAAGGQAVCGALATVADGRITLSGHFAEDDLNGTADGRVAEAEAIGRALAQQMLAQRQAKQTAGEGP